MFARLHLRSWDTDLRLFQRTLDTEWAYLSLCASKDVGLRDNNRFCRKMEKEFFENLFSLQLLLFVSLFINLC